MLSDDQGLLLAHDSGGRDAETRAGVSSLRLSVADRFEQAGVPAPNALVVHATANQSAVTRICEVDAALFVLTAVAKGRFVAPTVLDPALEKIQRLMADWTAAQVTGTG